MEENFKNENITTDAEEVDEEFRLSVESESSRKVRVWPQCPNIPCVFPFRHGSARTDKLLQQRLECEYIYL